MIQDLRIISKHHLVYYLVFGHPLEAVIVDMRSSCKNWWSTAGESIILMENETEN